MSKTFGRFTAAAVVYLSFAIYLYWPHFNTFTKLQFLILVNVCLASLGCFSLSRRWVPGFLGSFFAGAIYGFGPFALGLAGYHPTAGFLAAMMPWLFLPAAFGPKGKWQWLRVPLAILPFLAILLFFGASSHYRLFAVPMQTSLRFADLMGLAAPLVTAKHGLTSVGFYHVPVAALVMGFAMLFAARRWSVLIIFCLGVILASCQPLFGVSPIIWLSFSVLCCSILIGAGLQGLCSAGLSDRRWILLSMAFMAGLAIVTLLQATKYFQVFAGLGDEYANLFLMDAKLYIAGTVALLAVFFIARAKLRLAWLRWALLGSAMAVDIFFGARFAVDMMF
ncbi:MAG: hypothetical protein PHQ35_08215 [Phycisphaerae bacterium]|nr:hypothetical protein [Phycisphaerae bacterium]MDD5380146.1 hypothetical protein [Phycisphaerae bacterium]